MTQIELAITSTDTYNIIDLNAFKEQAFAWANQFSVACYLDSNEYPRQNYLTYEGLLAVGLKSELTQIRPQNAFQALKQFYDNRQDWLFGFFSYDLKNEVENLISHNFDGVGFPALHFFQPEVVLEIFKDHVQIHSKSQTPQAIFAQIIACPLMDLQMPVSINLQARIPKSQYLDTVESIRQHIIEGDLYEMNFCQEFFSTDCQIHAPSVFQQLNQISKAPFAAFYKLHDRYLMCASPERFLKKAGQKLISQPIKGTIRRGKSPGEDADMRLRLQHSRKDRAENVMIVDLVRNDLARSCVAGSVQVEELFAVYPFEHVWQMISTISGELRSEVHLIDAIKSAFPIGSMTGAPKVMSLELIEQYEQTKRGLYSGAIGYFSPKGDFDFNVVIRSILYDEINRYLSFQVGGAIVYDSVPEKEYEECLLKGKGMLKVLKKR